MEQVVKRYPRFDISFYTEDDEYHITYDSRKDFSNDFVGESVISLSTKNAMEDDSAVFSFVLAGDVYWDRVLQANDAVILKITPSEEGDQPENPVLLVGMVSEVALEGDYGENSKMYRITGQSFAKAFINFEVGVIQEVSVTLTDIGWLPDDDSGANGALAMSGKNASQMAEQIVDRFIEYMQYKYKKGGLDAFLEWEFDSWVDAEWLNDPTPFINYEGSLKQMLDDITGKPFNELFFDATPEGKCRMTMRRTPFDEADWVRLPTYYATSKDVISESVSISDTEAYSIFNVAIQNMIGYESNDLGSKPRFYRELMNKFGYKKLEVENRYLGTSIGGQEDDDTEDADTKADKNNDKKGEEDKDDTKDEKKEAKTAKADTKKDDKETTSSKSFNDIYALVMGVLQSYSRENVRRKKETVAGKIQKIDKRLTKNISMNICDRYYENGKMTKDDFTLLTNINRENGDRGNGTTKPSYNKVNKWLKENASKADGVTSLKNMMLDEFEMTDAQANSIASTWVQDKGLTSLQYKDVMKSDESTASMDVDGKKLVEFTERLANWYCENPNFYQGDIVVKGSPDYRLGGRLFVQDAQNNELWEYYIESVQHNYSYTSGYTTTLGVTRGLQDGGNARFHNLWGKSQPFEGGYLGEKTLQQLWEEQKAKDAERGQSSGGSSGGGTSGSGGEYTAGAGTQLAVFPIDMINITQGENGGFSHQGSLAMDFVGTSSGYPYNAPFDCECVYTSNAAVVVWQSQKPVKCVDGSVSYVTLMCIHDNNWASNKVGDKKAKGSRLGATGMAGNVTGDHAHFEASKQKWTGWNQNSYGQWCINNQAHMADIFSIKDNISGKQTRIVNGYGYNWRGIDWDDKTGKDKKEGKSKKDAKGGIYSPNIHGALGDYAQIYSNRTKVANPYKGEDTPFIDTSHVGFIERAETPNLPDVLPTVAGSAVAMNAFNFGMQFEKSSGRTVMYDWGSGHYDKYPFDDDIIYIDNSAFIWWCYKQAGITLGGNGYNFSGLSILNDSRLRTIRTFGQKDETIFNDMRVGDILSFTNERGTLGLYAGEGKVLICQGQGNNDGRSTSGITLLTMNQGDWWMRFNGIVKRMK